MKLNLLVLLVVAVAVGLASARPHQSHLHHSHERYGQQLETAAEELISRAQGLEEEEAVGEDGYQCRAESPRCDKLLVPAQLPNICMCQKCGARYTGPGEQFQDGDGWYDISKCCSGVEKCSSGFDVCKQMAGDEYPRCHGCGNEGQPCCSDNTCQTGVCERGSCVACGGKNQPCCPKLFHYANGCYHNSERLGCSTGFHCKTCGGADQPCCLGGECDDSLVSESSEVHGYPICTCKQPEPLTGCEDKDCPRGQYCDSGRCKSCGGRGEPCCPNRVGRGQWCHGGALCNGEICRGCGRKGEMCCENNHCWEGECKSNTCRAPWGTWIGGPCVFSEAFPDGYCPSTSVPQGVTLECRKPSAVFDGALATNHPDETYCLRCGGAGDKCCERGQQCPFRHVCVGGACVACGAPNEPCCTGAVDCRAGNCDGGMCKL